MSRGVTHAERLATIEAQIAAIPAMRADRDREISAIKVMQTEINHKLDLLIEDKQRRDGALGLGRWMIAVGIPSLVGGALLWVWHLFDGKN
jgi:hypothetical protein